MAECPQTVIVGGDAALRHLDSWHTDADCWHLRENVREVGDGVVAEYDLDPCPDCALAGPTEGYRDVLRHHIDEVAVARVASSSRQHHIPADPDGDGATTKCRHDVATRGTRKPLSVYPPGYREWCDECVAIYFHDELTQRSLEGVATDGGDPIECTRCGRTPDQEVYELEDDPYCIVCFNWLDDLAQADGSGGGGA